VCADGGEILADRRHRAVDDPLGPARRTRARCSQAGEPDDHQAGEPQPRNPHQIRAPGLESGVRRPGPLRIKLDRYCSAGTIPVAALFTVALARASARTRLPLRVNPVGETLTDSSMRSLAT